MILQQYRVLLSTEIIIKSSTHEHISGGGRNGIILLTIRDNIPVSDILNQITA